MVSFVSCVLPEKYGRAPAALPTRGQSLYLLSVRDGERYKVGIAREPMARLRALQSGNPDEIRLEGATAQDADGVDPAEFERRVHGLLNEHRVRGEWFSASLLQVSIAVKFAWLSLAKPGVIERHQRMRNTRSQICKLAERVRRQTTNRDILDICDFVLDPQSFASEVGVPVEVGIPATGCPECARRNVYQRELMRKRRAKA